MKNSFVKKITRFVSAALCAVMCITFSSVSSFAAGVDEPISSADGVTYSMITPYALDEPTELGQLPYSATIDNLSAQYFTRTKYYFTTSTGRLKLNYDLEATRPSGSATKRTLQFRLYYRSKTSSSNTWSTYSNKSVSFYNEVESEITFDGLSSNYYYYFDFYNTSPENSSWLQYNSISGIVQISG